MNESTTLMFKEATEAGQKIGSQIKNNTDLMSHLAKEIEAYKPSMVVLIGRGSSDHAGLFGKYLFEVETGLPVLHAAPSVVTLFNSKLQLNKALVIAISQSGQSPDIVEYVAMAQNQGAMTIAMVNDDSSPLAREVDHVVPLAVGEEKAVAATKSYLGSLSALLQLVANVKKDQSLIEGVSHVQQALQMAVVAEPQLRIRHLAKTNHCVVMGRGFGYAIGMEMALKLKEVCAIQAECFSSAEFLHGPVRIVSDNFRILDIHIQDETIDMHAKQSKDLSTRGASLIPLRFDEAWINKRVLPLAIMQRFYLDLEVIGREMGYNPDKPEGLLKVTETF